MSSVIIVVINESMDTLIQFYTVVLWQQVNKLIFYRFPKSLYPDIVFSPTSSIHAYLHLWVSITSINPSFASELTALVRVYDLGCTIRSNRILEHLYAV